MSLISEATEKKVYGYPNKDAVDMDLLWSEDHFYMPNSKEQVLNSLAKVKGKAREERHLDAYGRITIQQVRAILARTKPNVNRSLSLIKEYADDVRLQGMGAISRFIDKEYEDKNIKYDESLKCWGHFPEGKEPSNISADELKEVCRNILCEYQKLQKEDPRTFLDYPIMQSRGEFVAITPNGSMTNQQMQANKVKPANIEMNGAETVREEAIKSAREKRREMMMWDR